MGKKVKKVVSGVFKGIGSLVGGPSGKPAGNDALEAALEQQRLAAQNAQVDLSVENVPTIDTGGTAEAQAEAGTKARRRRTGGLSSSLGINVG